MKKNLRHLDTLRLSTIDERVAVLEQWVEASQSRSQIPEKVKQQVWITLSDLVLNRAKGFFKKSYSMACGTTEVHTERVVLLQQFLMEQYPKHSIRWCISAYRRRFSMFESYRQLIHLQCPLPGSISINTNGRRVIRDYNTFVRICKELGFNYYKADIKAVADKYRVEQRAKNKPCTDPHLNAFILNCHLYQDCYNFRYNIQYSEWKS